MMSFFFSDEVRRDPYPWYEQVRGSSPVVRDPRTESWMLFDYASVKRAMDDPATFSSRVVHPGGRAPEWLVFLDPPQHSKLRAIVSRAFTPRALAALEPRIRELSAQLLDMAMTRDTMDLVGDYAGPLPVFVIAELIGIPTADWPRFAEWSRVIVNLGYAILGGEAATRAVREHALVKQEMVDYLGALIEQRRGAPGGDLLSTIVNGVVDGERLDDGEILGFFQLLLSAATETTTNLIDNAMLCFMEHPDQLARLRAEPWLLSSAIEEVARYRSPGQIMFRQTTRDVEVCGQVIPANRFVLLMVGSANRDPLQFVDANRFDIGRDPNPHVAFGHGIHHCLGAALARLEARVALPDLAARMSSFVLAGDEPWTPRAALHVHGPMSLRLRVQSRVTV
jgi:cytochrome P450